MSVTQFHIRPTLRRLADGLEASAARRFERRQHDLAMMDPSMAVEHSIQVTRSADTGRGTCPYCR